MHKGSDCKGKLHFQRTRGAGTKGDRNSDSNKAGRNGQSGNQQRKGGQDGSDNANGAQNSGQAGKKKVRFAKALLTQVTDLHESIANCIVTEKDNDMDIEEA